MKISLERDALLAQLQTVSRVASTRSAIQALSGVQLCRVGRSAASSARPTWTSACGFRSRRRSSREGVVVLPARLLLDVVRSLPAEQVSLELRAGRAGRRARLRQRHVPHPDAARRGLPAVSRAGSRDARSRVPAEAFVSTALKVAGSASRDETRPVLTGILVSASERELRMVATDSYRLSVKETTLEAPLASRVRGQRAGASAAGAGAPGRARRGARQLTVSVRQNQVLFVVGRRDPLLAADRRPVPQLPPAAARELRARAPARRPRSSPTSCAGSACWPRRTRRCGWPSPPAS